MRRVYVRLEQADIERLARIAERQRRHPADEAAILLSRILREADAGVDEAGSTVLATVPV